MEIKINLRLLSNRDLSINEYLTLVKIQQLSIGVNIPYIGRDEDIKSLVTKGFIESNEDGLVLCSKALKIIGKPNNVSELAQELRDIFPKGKKSNQYYWRGGKKEIEVKLKSFMLSYKDATRDQIISATKKYVSGFNDFNMNNSMQLLKYFILKDNASTLYTEIENLDEETAKQNTFEERL